MDKKGAKIYIFLILFILNFIMDKEASWIMNSLADFFCMVDFNELCYRCFLFKMQKL
jgi:hypothetical protein